MSRNVLLVEDNRSIAEVIFDYFEDSDIELDYASNGTQGLTLALSENFDCIILDIMLPGIDGLMVCKQIRQAGKNTPIIMLTARDTNQDVVSGLEQGADDYLVKPFDLEVLEARVNSLIRRTSGGGFTQQLQCGELSLDLNTRQVTRSGSKIPLNRSAFEILKLLMQKFPAPASREELEVSVWQGDIPEQDILRKHMYQLRSKIDKGFAFPMIKTVPKIGYQIVIEDE